MRLTTLAFALALPSAAFAQDADADGWPVFGGDCNDADPTVHPGAVELCDGLDNDCDGVLDDGCGGGGSDLDGDGIPDARDPDADGDGVDLSTDCDDLDPAVHPAAAEVCDGDDEDCDGVIDEGCPTDDDGDGHASDVDCDDADATVHPGATEACNSVDDDCDGTVDEGCGPTTTRPIDTGEPGDTGEELGAGGGGCRGGGGTNALLLLLPLGLLKRRRG